MRSSGSVWIMCELSKLTMSFSNSAQAVPTQSRSKTTASVLPAQGGKSKRPGRSDPRRKSQSVRSKLGHDAANLKSGKPKQALSKTETRHTTVEAEYGPTPNGQQRRPKPLEAGQPLASSSSSSFPSYDPSTPDLVSSDLDLGVKVRSEGSGSYPCSCPQTAEDGTVGV